MRSLWSDVYRVSPRRQSEGNVRGKCASSAGNGFKWNKHKQEVVGLSEDHRDPLPRSWRWQSHGRFGVLYNRNLQLMEKLSDFQPFSWIFPPVSPVFSHAGCSTWSKLWKQRGTDFQLSVTTLIKPVQRSFKMCQIIVVGFFCFFVQETAF